jgi:hypothetical protein
MTALGHAALRQLALRVLARESGAGAGDETLAAAGRRVYDDLARASTPLIGRVGFDALMRRAVHLAQREHAWLVDTREPGPADEPPAGGMLRLEHQDPAVATEGAAAVFAAFGGLLVAFIGEPLTLDLLREAWPEAFSYTDAEET